MGDFSAREAKMLGDSEQEFSDVTLKLCYLDSEYFKGLKKTDETEVFSSAFARDKVQEITFRVADVT